MACAARNTAVRASRAGRLVVTRDGETVRALLSGSPGSARGPFRRSDRATSAACRVRFGYIT
ncbi:DUF3253 domain-containing protein [Nevskia ramosa]|uniref:DUF3253 domain-containing protein n=1 Tax=Nevskia ramosa TaxID=64002 RepID=UPI00344BC2B6